MTRALTFLMALLIASLLAWPAGRVLAQATGYTGCGGVASPPVSNASYEQTVITLVNAHRASNGGLPPLKRVEPLDQAARYHAIDMAQDRYFDHNTYDRNTSRQLIEICNTGQRLGTYYTNWSAIGENIASGQETPQEVVADWMASSGHRANILSTNAWEIGVGYSPGGIYGTSWVLDFGRRNNSYPLVINREDPSVDTRSVNLYIHGTWSEMRLHNDDNVWGDWQPFQNEFSWTLKDLSGERTVWVELRQGTLTHTTSDTIAYFNNNSTSLLSIYLPVVVR